MADTNRDGKLIKISMHQQNRFAYREAILLSIGSITLFGFLIYFNALGNDFVFDDHPMIEERAIITQPSLSSVTEILIYHYRPIRDLALMLIASIAGPYPVGFHLTNILIHLTNAVMVYCITLHLTQSLRIAALSSLLFTVHPVQTDAVTYVSGLRDTLSTLFVLIGFYSYMAYQERRGLLLFILFIGMLVLGVGTKEMAVGLVLLILLYDLKCEGSVQTSKPMKTIVKSTVNILRRGAFVYLPLAVFILLTLGFYLVLHHASIRIQRDQIHWWGGSILLNYLTMPKLWIGYLQKLIFPYPLMADYMGYPLVPVHPAEASAWLSLFMLIGVFYVALKWLINRPLWGFALGWVLLTLIPVVQIVPHHELMAEHHLYLPSVGFCLLVSLGISRMMDQARIKWAAGLMGILLAIIYSFQTVSRNVEWRNDLTLFQANLRYFPKAPRSYMQLGNFYQKAHLYIAAREAYDQALSIEPNFAMAHNNLGVLYYRLGQPERAIEEYQKALQGPLGGFAPAFTNLGMAYLILGQTREGIQALKTSLKIRPTDPKIITGLYYAYRDLGQESTAEGYLRQWLTLTPQDLAALQELARLKELREMQVEMEKLEKRMKSNQGNSESYLQVARYYKMAGADQKAQGVLEEALVHFPRDSQIVKTYLEFQIRQKSYNKNNWNRVSMIGKDFLKDPGVRLLIAQVLALDQKIDEAYYLVRDTLGSHDVGHELRNVVLPKGKIVSKCDQTRTLSKVFDLSGFPETALSVLEMSGCEGALLEEVHLERARLFNRLKKINASIRECERVLKMNPDSAQAHAALGLVMLKYIGDYETAALHLKESLQLDTEQKGSKQLRAIMNLLEQYIYTIRVKQTAVDPSLISMKISQLMVEYNVSVE